MVAGCVWGYLPYPCGATCGGCPDGNGDVDPPTGAAMSKLSHLLETTRRSWDGDPASRGAAKMTAGAALFAEGLFGGVSRLSDKANPLDRKKSKGGLFGNLFLIAFGAVFVVIGTWAGNQASVADPMTTDGRVVDVDVVRMDDGSGYQATYEYEVAGETYRVRSNMTSSNKPRMGSTKEVTYSASDPEVSQVTGGLEGMFHWIFIGAGGLVALAGLWGFLLGLVMIVFGAKLFFDGRKERASVGADKTRDGFFTDLMDLVRGDSRLPGQGDTDATASTAGTTSGTGLAGGLGGLLGGIAGAPAGAVPPPGQQVPGPTAPPAGWYADPHGVGSTRWWDGTAWTDHVQR